MIGDRRGLLGQEDELPDDTKPENCRSCLKPQEFMEFTISLLDYNVGFLLNK